jgi:nitroreductase
MKPKDFSSVIRNRRSVRVFKPDDIPDELIKEAINIARWAPSGANRQPWRFIVIKDPTTKKMLCEAAKAAFFQINLHVYEAPVLIVVCSNSKASAWHLYDTTNATMCLLLALEYLSLGSCWVGLFNKEKVKEILQIPKKWEVIALIPIGYPKETPSTPPRMDVEKITFYEKWGNSKKDNKGLPKINVCKSGIPSILKKAAKNALRCAYFQIRDIIKKRNLTKIEDQIPIFRTFSVRLVVYKPKYLKIVL